MGSEDAAYDRRFALDVRRPDRRARFLQSRRAVRRILASYLALDPDAVAIELSPDGKPSLPLATGLAFNISHCGPWTALAVAQAATVGIDAALHADLDQAEFDALRPLLTPEEAHALAGISDRDARRRLWIFKEAVGKALGRGLLEDLAAVEIGLDDASRPRRVSTRSGVLDLVRCPAPDGVAAALVAPMPIDAVRLQTPVV